MRNFMFYRDKYYDWFLLGHGAVQLGRDGSIWPSVSIFKLQQSVLYLGAEGSFKTLVPDSQVNSVPFNVSPTTSALSHKKPCDLKEISLSSADFMKKGNVLQLPLSSWDLMKKGSVFYKCLHLLETLLKGYVFTIVFIFCRLAEQRKCFYKCLYRLETW